jgi:SAM-dependent methyltransferase
MTDSGNSTALAPPESLTHQHLLSVINTECRRLPQQTIRLLDLGCGDCRMLSYLAANLPLLNPGVRFELYGLDVLEPGVQESGFLNQARQLLSQRRPSEDWSTRVMGISAGEPWPYETGYFDIVISNQVLEHVRDHEFLFEQLARTLRWGGWSAHLFPLLHYVYEGHLHLPLVHRILNYDVLRAYIRTLSRLGLGKFPRHRADSGIGLDEFAERHADYIHALTNYLTYQQALQLAKRHSLHATFRYTGEFYTAKLRSLVGTRPLLHYRMKRSSAVDWVAVMALRYVSSVTLFLQKERAYWKGA